MYTHPAPVTWTLSVPFSSYSIFASFPSPKLKKVSSGILICPVPFGFKTISPSVLVEEKVFPSKVKLSTFHWSTFLFESKITAKPFAAVVGLTWPATKPGAILNKSV